MVLYMAISKLLKLRVSAVLGITQGVSNRVKNRTQEIEYRVTALLT